jgi:hypothetical protein
MGIGVLGQLWHVVILQWATEEGGPLGVIIVHLLTLGVMEGGMGAGIAMQGTGECFVEAIYMWKLMLAGPISGWCLTFFRLSELAFTHWSFGNSRVLIPAQPACSRGTWLRVSLFK